jgi:ribonuclease P protein component
MHASAIQLFISKMNNSYPKKEKLCSKIIIDRLFSDAKSVYSFPLKVFWIIETLPEEVPVQSTVTVSKRKFKHAVKRNLLKRRMREAFRLNKHDLYDKVNSLNLQLALMIIYNHGEIFPYKTIEDALIKALNKITVKLDEIGSDSNS